MILLVKKMMGVDLACIMEYWDGDNSNRSHATSGIEGRRTSSRTSIQFYPAVYLTVPLATFHRAGDTVLTTDLLSLITLRWVCE